MTLVKRGFTLVEVVVGVLIFEVGFLGVATMFVVATKELRRAIEVEDATSATLDVLDSIGGFPSAGAETRVLGLGQLQLDVTEDGRVSVAVISHLGDTISYIVTRRLVTG